MEPLAAIGLASAIITFIELGSRVAKRLEELSEAGDVPKVFAEIRNRLPVILRIVERTRDGTQDLSDDAEASFKAIIRSCYEQVDQLQDLLQRVTVEKHDSKWKKGLKAAVSLVEERRVQRIATSLKDNVQLLTFINVSPAENEKRQIFRRGSAAPPPYASATGTFTVPFIRDERFVGREEELKAIEASFELQRRVAVAGIGGIG